MEKVQDYCHDCGELIGEWDAEYVSQNPHGSDIAREQASLSHRAHGCTVDYDHVVTCPDCGQVIGSWDCEYVERNPNGSDMAISQAIEEHEKECPVEQDRVWQEWRQKFNNVTHHRFDIDEKTTPTEALRVVLEEGSWYLNDIPCPPDRPEEYWPWADVIRLIDVGKVRRRLAEWLKKDRGDEVIKIAHSLGIDT